MVQATASQSEDRDSADYRIAQVVIAEHVITRPTNQILP